MIKLKRLLEDTTNIVTKIENHFIKYNSNSVTKDYEEYLEDGSIEVPSTITRDEGLIVFAYTADNTLFTKDPFKTALINVLKKLPKYSGEVYGSHKLKFANKKITLVNILSTTTDESLLQGDDFHYSSKDRTVFKIKVKSGVSIENISLYGDQESEILLLPGTTLQVAGKSGDYVVLKEV